MLYKNINGIDEERFQGSKLKPAVEASSLLKIESPVRIFASYSWRDRKTDIIEIASKLSKQTNASGQLIFDVWHDDETRHHAEQLYRQLADVILHSDLFLAFIDDSYQACKICECEFTYAKKLSKRILVVKMVDELSKQGWLDFHINGLPFVNYPPYHPIDMAYKDILEQINRMFAPPPPLSRISALVLTRPPTHKLYQGNKINLNNKPLKERLKMGLNACRYRTRLAIYGFLLFEQEEHVHLLDLGAVWGSDSIDFVRSLIDNVNSAFQCIYYDEALETVVLQPLFYAASLDKAKEDWKLNGISDVKEYHEQIRFMIAMGASRISQPNQPTNNKGDPGGEEIMVFQAIRQQRRNVVEQIVRTLNPFQLAEICCMKARHSKHMCPTLLHFLYHFEWWDDVKAVVNGPRRQLGCRHSYRIITKILLKLIHGGIDLGKPFKPVNWYDGGNQQHGISILTEPCHHGTCLIGDVINDANEDDYHWERLPIVELISRWTHSYLEGLWMNRLLLDNNTSIQVIGAIKGNSAEIDAFICDVDAAPETRDATMLAAARIGNATDFAYLFQKREGDKIAALENTKTDHLGQNSLMLAASNGHVSVVEYIIMANSAENEKISALIDMTDIDGRTAVMLAARHGHLDVVKLIVAHVKNPAFLLKARDKDERTALALAVENGHLDVVEFLYKEYSHALNFVDKYGLTVLMLAAKYGHTKTVEFLYRKKKLSMQPNEIVAALLLAAGNGHLEPVKCLSEKYQQQPGCPALTADDFGQTPLMTAAARGHLDVVKFLAEKFDQAVRCKDEQGRTALFLASEFGYLDVVKFLHGKFDLAVRWHDLQNRWPLLVACNNGHFETAFYLCEQFPDATKLSVAGGQTAFMLAAQNDHLQIVALLYGVNPSVVKLRDHQGKTALILAAQNGCYDTVKFICENCHPSVAGMTDNEGRTALMTAALNGHVNIAAYLYTDEAVTRTDSNNQTPFLLAALGGDVEMLRYLYQRSARTSQRDKNGRNAVMLASLSGKLDAVIFLTSSKEDALDEVDQNSQSAMMLAAMNGHLEVVMFLYTLCPDDTETADLNGQTGLILAAANGHLDVVKFLHDKPRESVMLRDKSDRTALMVAAENGYVKVVEFLYPKYSFAVNIRDKLGFTALTLARLNGHLEVVRLINEKTRRNVDNMMQTLVLD